MAKRYRVTLELAERDELEALLSHGKADARRLNHARILLKADESQWGPGCSDAEVADACESSVPTVERVRKRFVEEGLEMALSPCRTPRRRYTRKLDGDQEAKLIAIACSTPPEGCSRWSLRLLADKMVELEHVESICHETVRQTPKHGSWLNMAEIELNASSRQCLNRRIARRETLSRQTDAWSHQRNHAESTVDWQFKTKDARIKLRSLYPSIHD